MDGGSVIIPHPAYAKRHLAYLRCKPHTWRALRIVGREDALQNIWLAWLELGRPEGDGINKAVLRRAWGTIAAQALRMGREVGDAYDHCAHGPAPQHPLIAAVLDHYATHTASETIAYFSLPDTARVRYWLGQCLPKPGRAAGRKFGERLPAGPAPPARPEAGALAVACRMAASARPCGRQQTRKFIFGLCCWY